MNDPYTRAAGVKAGERAILEKERAQLEKIEADARAAAGLDPKVIEKNARRQERRRARRRAAAIEGIKFDYDHAWFFYHHYEPKGEDQPPDGLEDWAFSIGGYIKYFGGSFDEAVLAAKLHAKEVGASTIYLKP